MPKPQHARRSSHHRSGEKRGRRDSSGSPEAEAEADPWLSDNEFFLDIISPPETTALGIPFYVVARLIDPRDRHHPPPRLIENGTYDPMSARAVLFTTETTTNVREGPAYASQALQPEHCARMHACDLAIGRDFRVGLLAESENPPAGEYLVFKARFSEPGKMFLRLEVTWEREGRDYAAWFVTGEIFVASNASRQWLTPEDRAIVAALMPGEFPAVQEDPTCALVGRLLSDQPRQ
ncbi:hypothetical protein F5B21DRAFT_507452 [Xylaria acuta]|nr:hypothetical protein F5B21DRAFT_507452 [Xylaria acuta]